MPQAKLQTGNGPMPRQIPFIIANEGCERFSFYGMRNILTPFLLSTLLLFVPLTDRASESKHVFHTFVIGVYFFPLLGGWLADRWWGKYHTVFWFSLIYVAGRLFCARDLAYCSQTAFTVPECKPSSLLLPCLSWFRSKPLCQRRP